MDLDGLEIKKQQKCYPVGKVFLLQCNNTSISTNENRKTRCLPLLGDKNSSYLKKVHLQCSSRYTSTVLENKFHLLIFLISHSSIYCPFSSRKQRVEFWMHEYRRFSKCVCMLQSKKRTSFYNI